MASGFDCSELGLPTRRSKASRTASGLLHRAFRLTIGLAIIVAVSSRCTTDTDPIDPATEDGKACVSDAKVTLISCKQLARKEMTQCVERQRAKAEFPFQRELERYEQEVNIGLLRYRHAMKEYYRLEELRLQCHARNEKRRYSRASGQVNVRPSIERCPLMIMPIQEEFMPKKPTMDDIADDEYCYQINHKEEYNCNKDYDNTFVDFGGRYEVRNLFLGFEVGRRPR